MRQVHQFAALCALLLANLSEPGLGAELPGGVENFQKLHALIKPKSSEEAWVRIPWMTSLWAARQRAAVEGKPILLWEMDGHPLGCT